MTTENTRALVATLYLKLEDNHPAIAADLSKLHLTEDCICLRDYLSAQGLRRYSSNMIEFGKVMLIQLTDLVVEREFNFLRK